MASRPTSNHSAHTHITDSPEASDTEPSKPALPERAKPPMPDKSKPALPSRPKPTPPTSPSYVAPIPKIGPIGPLFSPGKGKEKEKENAIPSIPTRPKLPPFVGSFLCGKTVDEAGDIRDDKTGQVLARAGGDLPSMVGRKVSNRQGDILGDDGELLGYVADIEIEKKGGGGEGNGAPRSLFEVVGGSKAALMVDGEGNILDGEGNVVGRFHDNNNPMMRKKREEEAKRAETSQGPAPQENREEESREEESKERPPRRTEDERRQNAAAWRKENPGESPSDIFLDVKSTTEGIQLTIRIPTVFGGQQVRPNISFS